MARMVADILNDDFRNVINLNFRGTAALVRPIKNSIQRVMFPNGLVFDGEGYRTAETCLAFSLLTSNFEG